MDARCVAVPAEALQWAVARTPAQLQDARVDPSSCRMQDQRTALLESVMELEAQRAELRAEMQPLWARHQSLTRALPPCLQQVCNPAESLPVTCSEADLVSREHKKLFLSWPRQVMSLKIAMLAHLRAGSVRLSAMQV